MGTKNNVNPNHYKTAGREKPGQAIHHETNKQKYNEAMSKQNEENVVSLQNSDENQEIIYFNETEQKEEANN